jgi:hypothetical protein
LVSVTELEPIAVIHLALPQQPGLGFTRGATDIFLIMLPQEQRGLIMMPANVTRGQIAVSQTVHPLIGIVGLLSLLVGVAIVATATRRDEPDSKHAVKWQSQANVQ